MPDTTLCSKCGTASSVPLTDRGMLQYLDDDEASSPKSIEEIDRHLAECNEELAVFEGIIQQLNKRRNRLKRMKDEHFLPSSQKLPAEILCEIFAYVHSFGYALEVTMKDVKCSTLDLSHVCRLWRETTRSRPVLWSTMSIDLCHRNPAIYRLIKLYHTHSAQTPSTILITAGSARWHYLEPQQLEDTRGWVLLELLLEQSSLCKRITMRLSSSVFREIGLRGSFRKYGNLRTFDSLEVLTLDWHNESPPLSASDQSYMASFVRAPNLRYLSLSGFSWFPFPYSQLTAFRFLSGWESRHIIRFLRACPEIPSLTITADEASFETSRFVAVAPPIQIAVRSLFIEGGLCTKTSALLNSLVTDRLENLSVRAHVVGEVWDRSLVELILRSRCSLQTLTLKGDCMGAENNLFSLLSHVPTLTHLTLHGDTSRILVNNILNRLSIFPHTVTPVLPLLQSLCLRFEADTYTIFDAPLTTVKSLLTMAESRRNRDQTLRSCHYSMCVKNLPRSGPDLHIDHQSKVRMQALIEAGMQVSMTVKELEGRA